MVIIVGPGLSGLLTAFRLKKEGIPFKILEARARLGGRINTIYGTNRTPVEMGATWFTQQHKHLISLLEELGIGYFKQYMDGAAFYQPSLNSAIQSIQIPNQAPSYRISGGSSNLINALYQKLDDKEVLLNQSVRQIKFFKNTVQVITEDVFEAQTVILAIPPKLWAKKILFEPELPSGLLNVAKQTQTWMEESIKTALTYNKPFWQEENWSGTLFSNTGPITELYDHCNHERTKYALCGFINSSLRNLSYDERRANVINQLKTVFGGNAETFTDYEECSWSLEEHTFEASDGFLLPHQNNGHPIFSTTLFNDNLFISSSESAVEFPGYMEGAVNSANSTARKIIKMHKEK